MSKSNQPLVPGVGQAPKTQDPTLPIMQLSRVFHQSLPVLNAHAFQTSILQYVMQTFSGKNM